MYSNALETRVNFEMIYFSFDAFNIPATKIPPDQQADEGLSNVKLQSFAKNTIQPPFFACRFKYLKQNQFTVGNHFAWHEIYPGKVIANSFVSDRHVIKRNQF